MEAATLLAGLLRRTHLSAPGDLPAVVADVARIIGAEAVDLYLIDYDQSGLVAWSSSAPDEREAIAVTGTVAGKAYSSTTILQVAAEGDEGLRRLWLPLLDGTDRLGVMAMAFRAEQIAPEIVLVCERYAHLVATLLVTKGAYTDAFELCRRRGHKTIASELIWELSPPLLFATDDLVVAGMLEPAYDNGGDALDYAFNDGVLNVAIFDAMGHGLAAAGLATFALSAYRYSRRRGSDLIETYRAMDAAIGDQFPGEGFVTGLVAELDVRSGELTWLTAGHPPPLVIRGDRRARVLVGTPATPLGVPGPRGDPVAMRESLEPGDMLLLFTDGLTEARLENGQRMGVDGLRQFVERQAAAAQTSPETLRRLRQAIVEAHPGELEDDASALLVEWKRGSERMLLPPTV
ncbi:MAG TPA: PP2C family protein-serine/threonine phosphatase [Baekduia sp.]|uniref:PP2C family protein-serine/threonine phosphatase n=1 Tax=Baekduia sp. TaxID=2600305 RepID=UPI002C751CFA|nr:PP2C family protein-serine/threonine phosphatase [Baekduia sp.]HMJ35466.1 PP2C family protein-serine/threonine phosphatase [Baekduia sp.]